MYDALNPAAVVLMLYVCMYVCDALFASTRVVAATSATHNHFFFMGMRGVTLHSFALSCCKSVKYVSYGDERGESSLVTLSRSAHVIHSGRHV